MTDLVLASASLVRRQMLQRVGLEVTVDPAELDETAIKRRARDSGSDVAACALALALAKAASVATRHPDIPVLGADQMLDLDGEWLNKPASLDEARRQLQALSGRSHRLISAAVLVQNGEMLWQTTDEARLTMHPLDENAIDAHLALAGSAALASVGAYRLEEEGAWLFERVEGDFFTVLGLPLLPLLGYLSKGNARA